MIRPFPSRNRHRSRMSSQISARPPRSTGTVIPGVHGRFRFRPTNGQWLTNRQAFQSPVDRICSPAITHCWSSADPAPASIFDNQPSSPITRTPLLVEQRGGRVIGLEGQAEAHCWRGRERLEVRTNGPHFGPHFGRHLMARTGGPSVRGDTDPISPVGRPAVAPGVEWNAHVTSIGPNG